jgi:hypothetical protein
MLGHNSKSNFVLDPHHHHLRHHHHWHDSPLWALAFLTGPSYPQQLLVLTSRCAGKMLAKKSDGAQTELVRYAVFEQYLPCGIVLEIKQLPSKHSSLNMHAATL